MCCVFIEIFFLLLIDIALDSPNTPPHTHPSPNILSEKIIVFSWYM